MLNIMGDPSNKRILLALGMVTAGAVLACPAVGAGAAAGTIGGVLAGTYSSVLGTDIHRALSRQPLDTTTNHDLQNLGGRALAIIIHRAQEEHAPLTIKDKAFAALLRKPRGAFHELAQAVETHWHEIEFVGDHEPLRDDQIQDLFLEHDRTEQQDNPAIPAETWQTILEAVVAKAHTAGNKLQQAEHINLALLSEDIARQFTFIVRELVKADFDPEHGTAGRVFVALQLDMMRTMSVAICQTERVTTETLEAVKKVQSEFETHAKKVIKALTADQKQDRRLAENIQKFHESQAATNTALDAVQQSLNSLHNKLDGTNEKIKEFLDHQTIATSTTPVLPSRQVDFVGRVHESRQVRSALLGGQADPETGTLVGITPGCRARVGSARRRWRSTSSTG